MRLVAMVSAYFSRVAPSDAGFGAPLTSAIEPRLEATTDSDLAVLVLRIGLAGLSFVLALEYSRSACPSPQRSGSLDIDSR